MVNEARQDIKFLETHKKYSLHYLTGHNLDWYFHLTARPFFYLVALNIAFYLVGSLPTLEAVFEGVFLPLIFIVEIITYAWIGWTVAHKASWKTLPYTMKILSNAVAGGVAGLGVGIVMSLFKIFWFRELWAIYNIITEPSIRLLEGLVVAGVSGLITLFFLQSKHQANLH